MIDDRLRNMKKNAIFSSDEGKAKLVEGTRVFSFENKMPWFCTERKILVATVRPQMMISYDQKGDYRVSYTQDLGPELRRMRWTARFTAFDAKDNELFVLFVDTRELTAHPGTNSWVYQIHTGIESQIARHFGEIASWSRDLAGNGWFVDA